MGSLVFFGSNFMAEFVDYHGVRLGGIESAFGLRVIPSVFHRAREMGSQHRSGFAARGVNGGQVAFSSLALKGLAGRNILLRFKEVTSNLQVSTSRFSIYPFALSLAQPVPSATAGAPVSLALELHDHQAQVPALSRLTCPFIWLDLLIRASDDSTSACILQGDTDHITH
jgi:hypothetical protein